MVLVSASGIARVLQWLGGGAAPFSDVVLVATSCGEKKVTQIHLNFHTGAAFFFFFKKKI